MPIGCTGQAERYLSTAFSGRIRPLVANGSVIVSNGVKGWSKTIWPVYLPVTFTSRMPGMSPA